MKIYTIYKITNLLNDKVYIGYTSQLVLKRWTGHLTETKRGSNTQLHNSIRKHGETAFVVDIIYQSKDLDHTLNIMEPYFIKEYNSIEQGYNIQPGGGYVCPNEGYRWYNNRTIERMFRNSPPIGSPWRLGRSVHEGSRATQFKQGIDNRGANNGMFGRHGWNRGLHGDPRCKLSNKQRKGLSLRNSGSGNPMFGSTYTWINNGINNKRHDVTKSIPIGWYSGMAKKYG